MASIMEVLSPLPPSPPRQSPPSAASPSFWFRSPQSSPTRAPQRSPPFLPLAPTASPPTTSEISASGSSQPNKEPSNDVERSRPSGDDPQEGRGEEMNEGRPRMSTSSESGNVEPALGASSSFQAYLNTIPPIWREVPPTPPTPSHRSTSTSASALASAAASPVVQRRSRPRPASAVFGSPSLHQSRRFSSDDSTSQSANNLVNGQDIDDEDKERDGEMGPGSQKKSSSRRRVSYPALGTSSSPPDVPPLPALLTNTRSNAINDYPSPLEPEASKPLRSPDLSLDPTAEIVKAEKRLFHIVGDDVGSDDEDHPVREPARVNDEETDRREKMRLIRRYHALTELLTTEVGYLVDLRALVNVSSRVPSLVINFPGCLV